MKKKLCLLLGMLAAASQIGCSAGNRDVDTGSEKESFVLLDEEMDFLTNICKTLDDFDSQKEKDEEFWWNFLFYSYTGASPEEAEMTQVYREDLGFDETVVKVSLEEVEAYAKLVFGLDFPDYKPAFEDMPKGQTSCYYQDGYYYIGVSDFPAYQYNYAGLTLFHGKDNAVYEATVLYNMDFEGETDVGTVTLTLRPAENENGFILIAKQTERISEFQ